MGRPIPAEVMESLLAEYHVPASSIATIHDGEIDWVQAYGLRKQGHPVRIDSTTLFQAASISKPVTAVMALRMVEQGVLTLDENINYKLTSWKVPTNRVTRDAPVTLRRLLSHSAGFPMHGVPEFEAQANVPSLVQILNGEWYGAVQPVRPIYEPGTQFRYSGGGYIVLQVLLTDIAKRPFAELANEWVFKPAGMAASTFAQPLPREKWSQAAVGHLKNGTPLEGQWHTVPAQAAGGLWTTPKDLARLMILLWRSYHGLSDTLLPQALAREMLSRQIDDFGLGLYLPSAGVFRFNHSGGNGGYRCFMVLSIDVPEGVVIMTNGESGEDLIWAVFELIAEAYGWDV